MKYTLSPKKLTIIALLILGIIGLGVVYVIAGSVMERVPRTELAVTSNNQPSQPLPPADRPLSLELAPSPLPHPKPPVATPPISPKAAANHHKSKSKEKDKPSPASKKPKSRPILEINLPF